MGLQAAHYARIPNLNNEIYDIIGFLDDEKPIHTQVGGLPVIGTIDDAECLFKKGTFDKLFIAIGYKHLRFKRCLISRFKSQIQLANIVHKSAIIDSTAFIGVNVMIYPGCIIDKNVTLNDGVTLNLGSIISHDSHVGNSTFIAPGATIAGFSKIGAISFIGCGSTIIDNVELCENVKIGAGALVISDITEKGTYIGVPATRISNKL